MSDSFLTLEDINSVVAEYYNVPFWSKVSIGLDSEDDFSNVKFDYCTVDREYSNSEYVFTIQVDNDLWKGQCYFIDDNEGYISDASYSSSVITVESDTPFITACFYMDMRGTFSFQLMDWIITEWTPKFEHPPDTVYGVFTIESVNPNFEPNGKTFTAVERFSYTCTNNEVKFTLGSTQWFNFTCSYNGVGYTLYPYNYKRKGVISSPSNNLICGKINNLKFDIGLYRVYGTYFSITADYPISNVTVKNYNDLYFDIDLRKANDLKKIKITIDYNDSNNYCSGVFSFDTVYATLTTEEELSSLMSDGGVGKLGADITLTGDLTVNNNVSLVGDGYTIDCDSYKLIVDESKSLKLEDIGIINGVNTIQQLTGTTVELTDCSFTDCTSSDGVGGVIDCDVTLASLDNPTDFTTIITGCSFTNCDCPILHGGELTITNCQVSGKLSDYDFPYFLYQTDGRAVITQTQFSITNDTAINEDIKFNSCIFTCGKTATINGMDYNDLQKNEVQAFIERNSSIIDLTYYYEPIEQNITLQSSKGYCHSVSNDSHIYKTNIEIIRGE